MGGAALRYSMKARVLRPFVLGDRISGVGDVVELGENTPNEILACVQVIETKMAKPANKARQPRKKEG